MPSAGNTEQLTQALGEAVIRIWSDLPQDVKNRLFKEAVASRGESDRSSPFSFTITMSGLPIPWAIRAR